MRRMTVDFVPTPEPHWRLTTEAAEAVIALGTGGPSLGSLTDRRSGATLRGADRHPAVVLALAGERLGPQPWRLRSWEGEEQQRSLVLRLALETTLAGAAVVLTESVWLAADLPVLRRWVDIRNEGEAPLTIDRYHLLDLALDHDPAEAPLELFSVDAFAGHRLDRWEPGDANFSVHVQRLSAGAAVRYAGSLSHGPNLCLYSPATMKAFTISAFTKLPLNWLSFASQKL